MGEKFTRALQEYQSAFPGEMQFFTTGATRSAEGDKLDYEGFLSPFVLERYAQYLHEHRTQADGKQRSSDNWQGGMPRRRYLKSAIRHLMEIWKAMRTVGWKDVNEERDKVLQDAICGVMFNMMGLLYEILRGSDIDG